MSLVKLLKTALCCGSGSGVDEGLMRDRYCTLGDDDGVHVQLHTSLLGRSKADDCSSHSSASIKRSHRTTPPSMQLCHTGSGLLQQSVGAPLGEESATGTANGEFDCSQQQRVVSMKAWYWHLHVGYQRYASCSCELLGYESLQCPASVAEHTQHQRVHMCTYPPCRPIVVA